ncbi:MAG: hypothetical protein QW568_04120 [Candidatus Anstonellaceae archaeon]
MAEINGQSLPRKRGILFTLSAMLLGISLLAFASAISQQSAKAKAAASMLAEVDRTTGTYSNMEDVLEKILSPAINISVQNSTVWINESLPLSPQVSTNLDRFSRFESLYSDQNITMELANLKGGYFVIRPGEVSVTNAPGEFFITPQNSPDSSDTVNSYYVELVVPAGGADSAAWQLLSNSSGSRMAVRVVVRDEDYAFYSDAGSILLDRHGTSVLNVSNAGSQVALVTFSSPAALHVEAPGNIGLKTSVGFTNPVRVEANDVLTVLGAANRTGYVRIA